MQTYDGFVLPKADKVNYGVLPRWCSYCGDVFNNFDVLYNHKKLEHKDKVEYMFCGFCGKHKDTIGVDMWDHYYECSEGAGWSY